jgi:hypothetical protein
MDEVQKVLLAISPTAFYLILAVVLLLVVMGGTYLAYRASRGSSSRRS